MEIKYIDSTTQSKAEEIHHLGDQDFVALAQEGLAEKAHSPGGNKSGASVVRMAMRMEPSHLQLPCALRDAASSPDRVTTRKGEGEGALCHTH